MLSSFIEFFDINESFESSNLYEDFCKQFSGKSFGEGLFNTFVYEKRAYWNELIGKCFPAYGDKVNVIGYDWLGRVSATLKDSDCVKLFEIGTGEVLNIGCTVEEFLDEEIPVYSNDSLAHQFFNEWKETSKETIPYGHCVSYKVPLFLGGEDNVSNLELSDMDVYWNVVGPMLLA